MAAICPARHGEVPETNGATIVLRRLLLPFPLYFFFPRFSISEPAAIFTRALYHYRCFPLSLSQSTGLFWGLTPHYINPTHLLAISVHVEPDCFTRSSYKYINIYAAEAQKEWSEIVRIYVCRKYTRSDIYVYGADISWDIARLYREGGNSPRNAFLAPHDDDAWILILECLPSRAPPSSYLEFFFF